MRICDVGPNGPDLSGTNPHQSQPHANPKPRVSPSSSSSSLLVLLRLSTVIQHEKQHKHFVAELTHFTTNLDSMHGR